MATIYIDSSMPEDERRRLLYAGDFFVLSPSRGSQDLCDLARELSEEAFSPHHPATAQDHMPPEQYAGILLEAKPTFIHHPKAKSAITDLLTEAGCDLDKTYFDVPRLRTMAHGEYMRAGLALQFHPHRDTWFSAPYAQLNWWLPVYEIESENSMAFHPHYFDQPSRTAQVGTTTTNGTKRTKASRAADQGRHAQATGVRGEL